MSAVVQNGREDARERSRGHALALFAEMDLSRPLVWHQGRSISAGEFLVEAQALAQQLPDARFAVNLCEDRYRFLVAFCAVAIAGQTNLLPSSRAPQAVDEVMHSYLASYALSDRTLDPAPPRFFLLPKQDNAARPEISAPVAQVPQIAADHIVAIGFTSGSTGAPKANPKTWASICATSALNDTALSAVATAPNILATVPAQHMYGLELSILLPLRSLGAVHSGHPLFPADVAQALGEMPVPRVLVTTPFHLRALIEDRTKLPSLAAIVTATAPLDVALAALAEQHHDTQVVEMFGSTETCVIAQRRTARGESWSLYPNVELHPQPDGTLVTASHFAEPTLLQDIVELLPARRFNLRGRNGDLLEIAGKRASLADLTRRLLAIPGVLDGVVFQLNDTACSSKKAVVRRLAALVVAPTSSNAEILSQLRDAIDPVFLPRPLRRVKSLPRNATGKLPREALLAVLSGKDSTD